MRYSANLNIIIKAIEKATSHAARDFIELENLQSNPFSANKFANACYKRVKQVLFDDFSKFRPQYNIIFSDSQKVIRSNDAEYSYIVHPIDGFANLARSNPDFTVAVALQHRDKDAQNNTVSLAINKVSSNELYYCEKGFGSFLNNRRIRASKRTNGEVLLAAGQNQELLLKKLADKKISLRSYDCSTMELAYLASARLEAALFNAKNFDLLRPFLLLASEAGLKIEEDKQSILVTN